MSNEPSVLIRFLGASPKMRIIDFFLDNKLLDFTKKEIVEELGMSYTTFYKVWDEFERFEVVKVNRKIARAKLYKLNRESPIVKKILELERFLIDRYVESFHEKRKPLIKERIEIKRPLGE